MTWTLGVVTLGGALPGSGVTTTFDVMVEVALTSGYTTPAASRVWTEVTDYVEAQRGLTIAWGRGDQFSSPQPSRLTVTLDNRDGRFTPENAAGAYYPNIKKGRPIRVRVRPAGGGYVHRFLGYVDEWPVEWPDGTSAMSTVTITALSRQARLGRSTAFKSIVEEEILYDTPALYFPLGEPQGATTAGNIAPGRTETMAIKQVGSGGAVTFGAATGPGTDDLTAPQFAPVNYGNGKYLEATLASDATMAGDHHLEVELAFTSDSTVVTGNVGVLAALYRTVPGGFNEGFLIAVDQTASTGTLLVQIGFPTTINLTPTGSPNVRDGNVHHAVGRLSISDAGSATFTITLDGTSTSTAPFTWPYVVGGVAYFPSLRSLAAGGLAVGAAFGGSVSHLALYRQPTTAIASTRFDEHRAAMTTGFLGEASGARVARYARLAGIPTAEISTETGLSTSIAHKDTTGDLPISLMQAVADTEDGVVFDGKDGTLTFHARSHRYNAPVAFTLDANLGDIGADLQPKLDDQHLTNDMTASRPNGITVRSTNPASITEYGFYRESLEVLTTSDNEVQARADWEVNRFGTPRVSIPNVSTDLLTSSVASALLAADIGTKFRLTNLPSQAPATTADYFIEGGTEQIGVNSYTIQFNVSAAAYANVWQLDSATLSQLDSSTVLAY